MTTRRTHTAAAALAVAALAALVACAPTQRYPGPMDTAAPLPPSNGAWYAPGLLEVEVWRHADPVSIRRAGSAGGFPMSYLRKTERISSGSIVQTAPGGRAEIIWPVGRTSVMLFDEGAVIVTAPRRDEPTAVFLSLTRAELFLSPADEVMLPGGAMLAGDTEDASGPFFVSSKSGGEIVRLENRSKHVATVRYLEELLQVFPSESIDLPLLSPEAHAPDLAAGTEHGGAGAILVKTSGDAVAQERGEAIEVRARGPAHALGLGVQVQLRTGDRATFRPLGSTSPPAESPDDAPAEAADELPPDAEMVDGGEAADGGDAPASPEQP
jgi:hypothetical protein